MFPACNTILSYGFFIEAPVDSGGGLIWGEGDFSSLTLWKLLICFEEC